MEMQDVVKEWEQQLRAEGEKKAAATIHLTQLHLYRLRFGVAPDEAIKAHMQSVSDLEVLARWTVLITSEPKEVVDRVLSGALS